MIAVGTQLITPGLGRMYFEDSEDPDQLAFRIHRVFHSNRQNQYLLSNCTSKTYELEVHTFTLKAPITTAADDKFCDIFPNFRKE